MKIAFLGDSITEGYFEIIEKSDGGFEGVKDAASAYVSIIERRLKERFSQEEIEIINAGVNGNTSKDGLERLEKDVIEKNPDIALVCFGLNDAGQTTPEDFKNNLSEIFRRLKDSEIKTVFITPNMTNTSAQDFNNEILRTIAKNCAERQTDGTMDLYMETARNCADDYEIALCDAYSVWKKLYEYGVDTNELLSNRINHPTRAMHRLFADLAEPVLIRMIRELSEGR